MHAGSGAARSTTYSSSCIRIVNHHGWSCIVQGEASWGLKGILVDASILTIERNHNNDDDGVGGGGVHKYSVKEKEDMLMLSSSTYTSRMGRERMGGASVPEVCHKVLFFIAQQWIQDNQT